jgi:hypothetical protein
VTTRLAPLPPAAHAVGATTFARYAYPPNARGLCGPDDAEELFGYAATGAADRGLDERARAFAGAWPYLELIAGAVGGSDALDPRVVRAYWLGMPPVDAVTLRALADHVDGRFRHRSGGGWDHLAAALRPGAVPDHAFHVLAVYPWTGMLREGIVEPARSVIESCAIRPGRVVSVGNGDAEVEVPTLVPDERHLRIGPPSTVTLRWRGSTDALVDGLAAGDLVAVHWDWICDRLDADEYATVGRSLGRALAITDPAAI